MLAGSGTVADFLTPGGFGCHVSKDTSILRVSEAVGYGPLVLAVCEVVLFACGPRHLVECTNDL